MKVLRITISFLLISIFSYGVSHAQETIIFAAAADSCGESLPAESTLYIVNPLNGNSSEVGPIGFDNVTGLAILGDGRLVGSAQADDNGDRIAILIEIDPLTGQGSLIGEIGDNDTPGECGRAPDITYDPVTDKLHGIGVQCNGLQGNSLNFLEINQITGAGSIIGPTGFNGGGNGLAVSNSGTFFATSRSNPNLRLITINPANGQGALQQSLDIITSINSLAFHPGTGELFGVSFDAGQIDDFFLSTIDTGNFNINQIGQLPDCTDALIFRTLPRNVPTLSQWGLIAMAGVLGIVGILGIRRRKITA